MHSCYSDAPAFVAVRILLFETVGDDRHLALRSFERNTRFELADSEIVSGEPSLSFGWNRTAWEPEIRSVRKTERLRHNAHNRRWSVGDADCPSQYMRIAAEMSHPVGMADQQWHSAPPRKFRRSKHPSAYWIDRKNAKELGTHQCCQGIFSGGTRHNSHFMRGVIGHRLKGGTLVMPVLEVRDRDHL